MYTLPNLGVSYVTNSGGQLCYQLSSPRSGPVVLPHMGSVMVPSLFSKTSHFPYLTPTSPLLLPHPYLTSPFPYLTPTSPLPHLAFPLPHSYRIFLSPSSPLPHLAFPPHHAFPLPHPYLTSPFPYLTPTSSRLSPTSPLPHLAFPLPHPYLISPFP